MTTSTIGLNPLQACTIFGDPTLALMMGILVSQDRELVEVSQEANKVADAAQGCLTQTFEQFKTSEDWLQKKLAEVESRNSEANIAQETEIQELQRKIGEQAKKLATQAAEQKRLTDQSNLLTDALRAVREDCIQVRQGIRAYTNRAYQDPASAAASIIGRYPQWCASPYRGGPHIAARGYKVLLEAHTKELAKIRTLYPGIL